MQSLRTLTIVKTDIRRFTDRVHQMKAEELDAFLREHRALLGGVLQRYSGNLIKEIGDSYLVTFESSTNALLACIALQRELRISTSGQSPSERTEIRIAVTAGDVLLQEGDIFGTPVNAVARVEALAPPGEIYFTEAVYQNLNRNEVASELVGTFSLKGITEPARIYRTTFRHQTRTLHGVTVLFTEIKQFNRFAETADVTLVEQVLDFWDQAHREVVHEHAGVIRLVLSESYFLTFDTAALAVRAWLDLARRVVAFNRAPDAPFQIGFGAGVDVGDIRIFRSSIYGSTADRAAVLCACGRGGSLLLDERLLRQLTEELRAALHIDASGEPLDGFVATRAAELGLGTIVRVIPAVAVLDGHVSPHA